MGVKEDIVAAGRRHEALIWHSASYGFNRGFPLISSIVAARVLDIAAFGEFVAGVTFFATALTVVDLGLSLAVTSRVANNTTARPAMVPLTVFIAAALCLALGLLVSFAAILVDETLSRALFGSANMEPFLHVAALYVPAAGLAAVLGGAFVGIQRYRTQAIVSLTSGIGYFVAVVLGAWWGGAVGAAWGAGIGMLMRAAIAILFAIRSPLVGGWRADRKALVAEGRALGAIALPASIAAFAWMPTNSIMLALLLGEPGGQVEAGGLGASLQVFSIALALPSLLSQFTLSRLSLISGLGSARLQKTFVLRWGVATTLITLFAGGIVALAAPSIMRVFGAEFVVYGHTLIIMMGCALLAAPQGIFSNYLVAAGHHWARVAHWYVWAALVLTIQFTTPHITALTSAWAYLGGWIGLVFIQGVATIIDLRRRLKLEETAGPS